MTSHYSYLVPYLLLALVVAISLLASGHGVLSKRDTRAAVGWIGLIWLSPLVETVIYWLLGNNRISRKARSLRGAPLPTSDIDPPVGSGRPGLVDQDRGWCGAPAFALSFRRGRRDPHR